MYAAGELVVYGGEGVCRVEGVGAPSLPGMDKTRLYYTLSPLYRSGQVMTPVDTQVLMRPLLTPEETAQLIAELDQLPEEQAESHSMRAIKDLYHQVLTSYDCRRLAGLIKGVCRRRSWAVHHGRKISQMDERYLKQAEQLLFGELAAALENWYAAYLTEWRSVSKESTLRRTQQLICRYADTLRLNSRKEL